MAGFQSDSLSTEAETTYKLIYRSPLKPVPANTEILYPKLIAGESYPKMAVFYYGEVYFAQKQRQDKLLHKNQKIMIMLFPTALNNVDLQKRPHDALSVSPCRFYFMSNVNRFPSPDSIILLKVDNSMSDLLFSNLDM